MNHFPLLNQVTLYVLVKCVLGGLGGKSPQKLIFFFQNFCQIYLQLFASLG